MQTVAADETAAPLSSFASRRAADTEKSLLKNIRALENKTVLLISHKAAARDVCDLEISVEGGALREIAK